MVESWDGPVWWAARWEKDPWSILLLGGPCRAFLLHHCWFAKCWLKICKILSPGITSDRSLTEVLFLEIPDISLEAWFLNDVTQHLASSLIWLADSFDFSRTGAAQRGFVLNKNRSILVTIGILFFSFSTPKSQIQTKTEFHNFKMSLNVHFKWPLFTFLLELDLWICPNRSSLPAKPKEAYARVPGAGPKMTQWLGQVGHDLGYKDHQRSTLVIDESGFLKFINESSGFLKFIFHLKKTRWFND